LIHLKDNSTFHLHLESFAIISFGVADFPWQVMNTKGKNQRIGNAIPPNLKRNLS